MVHRSSTSPPLESGFPDVEMWPSVLITAIREAGPTLGPSVTVCHRQYLLFPREVEEFLACSKNASISKPGLGPRKEEIAPPRCSDWEIYTEHATYLISSFSNLTLPSYDVGICLPC